MKKDIITKIISTIICLGLIVGGYFLIKNKEKNEGGTITIILSDPFNDYYNEKTIEFSKNQTLEDIIKLNYQCEISNGFLYSIDELHTADDFSTFIYIYINNAEASEGISTYYPQNNDVIKFEIVEYYE